MNGFDWVMSLVVIFSGGFGVRRVRLRRANRQRIAELEKEIYGYVLSQEGRDDR